MIRIWSHGTWHQDGYLQINTNSDALYYNTENKKECKQKQKINQEVYTFLGLLVCCNDIFYGDL